MNKKLNVNNYKKKFNNKKYNYKRKNQKMSI